MNAQEKKEINDKLLKLRKAIFVLAEKMEDLEIRLNQMDQRVNIITESKIKKKVENIFAPQEVYTQKLIKKD